ncbi:MAG: aminoacyl-tRNA hydrolase [Planctomycetes bacterium]|nr:aminoacyl-tRNA hydrolase [Planctomycetota bacterium]
MRGRRCDAPARGGGGVVGMKVVVGLGNPGAEYDGTRHNLGFEVVARVASRLKISLREGKGPARSARLRRAGDEILLVCPLTYMNLSGDALAQLDPGRLAGPDEVLVVCDDLALPPGRLRLRASGSDGGHNGLKSIERQLGSAGYPRLRLGIGAAPPGKVTADWVLERPDPAERALLDGAVAEAVHGVVAWLDSTPLATLMNRLNRDPTPAKAKAPPPTGQATPEEPRSPRGDADHHRD